VNCVTFCVVSATIFIWRWTLKSADGSFSEVEENTFLGLTLGGPSDRPSIWRQAKEFLGLARSFNLCLYYSTKLQFMLRWTVIFLIIALIAGAFGFFGIAAGAASIAKVLFFIFIILFVISLIGGRRWGRSSDILP
jgi:uncharacterized membrane protein YtjA (UPF0391 family)